MGCFFFSVRDKTFNICVTVEDRHAKHILQQSATKIWFEINIILAFFVCLLFAPFCMLIFLSLLLEGNTKLSVNRRNYTNLNFHVFTIFVSVNYEEQSIGSSTSDSYRNKNRAEKNIGNNTTSTFFSIFWFWYQATNLINLIWQAKKGEIYQIQEKIY